MEPVPSETITQKHCSVGVTAVAPWRVRAINVLPDYRLFVTCNDGTKGMVDMSALVKSADAGIFSALKDLELFQQVNIALGVITWPNGVDLDPAWVDDEIGKNKIWSIPVC